MLTLNVATKLFAVMFGKPSTFYAAYSQTPKSYILKVDHALCHKA
jgi:hypothetical protein